MAVIPAAGTVPWRRRQGQLEVALVHRPKYDDWSWAKGKLDPGEEWPVAAVRETHEETALEVRLGRPLPAAAYTVLDRDRRARDQGGPLLGRRGHRRRRPARQRDRRGALARRGRGPRPARLRPRPRPAARRRPRRQRRRARPPGRSRWSATPRRSPRSQWTDPDDQLRPLDRRGGTRASAIAPLLAAYGVRRLVELPVGALRRHARARMPRRWASGCASGTALPRRATARTRRAPSGHLQPAPRPARRPAVLCSHGPVLPDLLDHLAALVDRPTERRRPPTPPSCLDEAAETGWARARCSSPPGRHRRSRPGWWPSSGTSPDRRAPAGAAGCRRGGGCLLTVS